MEGLRVLTRRKALRVTLTLVIALILLYVIPVPAVGEPIEALAQEWSRFIEVEGIKIHYVEANGHGNLTFVLLHGFGASVFSWREVLSDLSNYGRVIAFDRPGFGLSERVDPAAASFNPYSVEGQVKLAYGLLARLNVTRAVLLGHSAGGGVALLFALEYPHLVEALVLIAPAWRPSKKSFIEVLAYSIPLADKYGPLVVRGLLGRLEQVLYRAWYNRSKLVDRIVEGYKYPLRARDWDKGLYWLMKYGAFPDIRERVGGLRIPTLIVHGINDEIVHVSSSMELAKLLSPGVYYRLVVMEECGHLPHEEKPGEFMRALHEFIADLNTNT